MAPNSPIGIELFKGKTPKWRVGKELGSGACATVHVLEEIDGTPTEWAIKLAPIPTKKTKKGMSVEEVNDRMLYHEHVMYQNQFQDIQGTYVPKLPPYRGPQTNGEAEGYRFLVMERMECPLNDIVLLLLKQSKSTKTVSFGPVAVQLLKCVQAIQERKHVVVDIKPENFMISSDKGKGTTVAQKLAANIRILDLALVQPWASIGSHRTNDGTSGVAGTPLYASLNVHGGETPSRRDDFEALGYVMAELMMKVSSGNASMELPWSHGTSDDEIGGMKAVLVDDINSAFYLQLGGPSVAKSFKDYMDTVRGYGFKKLPDYDELVKLLSKLNIPTPKSAAPRKPTSKRQPIASSKRTPAAASTGTKRMTRSRATDESAQSGESPSKLARDDTYMEIIDVDESFESVSYVQAEKAAVSPRAGHDDDSFTTAPMDWEVLPDENEDPVPYSKPKAVVGLTIVIESGPHKGGAINLVKGRCETVVVGRNPITKGGETGFSLSEDSDVDDSHIRIDLAISKKLSGVLITDLKSSGSFVGREKIRPGKDWKLFRGDSVQVGNSILTVNNLDAKKLAFAKAPREMQAARPTRSSPVTEEPDIAQQTAERPQLKRRGVKIVVSKGPHSGEVFELEHGITESLNVGSKPTGNADELISLSKDKSLKANHVRIELYDHKKLKAVVVTDKSKGGILVDRDTIKKGRAFINSEIKIGLSVLVVKPL